MDLNSIPLMNAVVKKMGWLTQKQRMLSQNIANADTPGYAPKTLKPQDFKSLLAKAPQGPSGKTQIGVAMTDDRHMPGVGGTAEGKIVETKGDSYESTPNGNSVILEEQMMDLTNTQMEYGLMVSLYRKHIDILRASLGRPGR